MDIKKKFENLLNFAVERPWFSWIIWYIFIVIFAIILSKYILDPQIDQNSLYLLSALIQSQAAIISIVTTLTLIAMQLHSSNYSSKIVVVIRRNPSTWLLLFFYIFSISISCIVMRFSLFVDYIFLLNFSFSFAILLFFTLIFHIYYICYLFEIPTIFKICAKKININNDFWLYMIPIFDIINVSILNRDYNTTKAGLYWIISINEDIMTKLKKSNETESEKLVSNFIRQLSLTAKIAIKNEDEESISEIIKIFQTLSKFLITKKYEKLEKKLVNELKEIGVKVGFTDLKKQKSEFYGTLHEIRNSTEDWDKNFRDVVNGTYKKYEDVARKYTRLKNKRRNTPLI